MIFMREQFEKFNPHEISTLLRGELATIAGWIEQCNGGEFVPRQPAFVDSAPVHWRAQSASGIFPRRGVAREFLRKYFPNLAANFQRLNHQRH